MDSKKINITFRRTQGVMPKYNHVHTARGVGFAEQPPHLPHQVQVTTHKYIRTTHSFRNCRHPFINASGCLNPELGQRGDDDAYRRWQALPTSDRRGGKSSRAHTKRNRRIPSGQTRGDHQDQGRVNSHSGHPGDPYASGQHGGVPPSSASSAPAAAHGMRLAAAETRTRASLALSAPANNSSTAVRRTRSARRQHCRGPLRLFRKALVHLMPACQITQHKLPLF